MDYGQLKQRLGRRRGFDGNINRLGDFINDAYLTICGRRSNWSWLRRVVQFHTEKPITSSEAYTWTQGRDLQNFNTGVAGDPGGSHSVMEDTFTGAKLRGPDGLLYRIRARGNDGFDANGTGAEFLLQSVYLGATTASHRAKLYTDEYPLPPACGEVESIIYTGGGQTNHIRSLSILPQDMHGLTINNYESYPSYYSVEQVGTIPTPDVLPSLTPNPAATLMDPGYYKYKYRYFNTRTREFGPFSDEREVQLTSGFGGVTVIAPRCSDYGIAFYRTKVSPRSVARGDTSSEFFLLATDDRDNWTDVNYSWVDNRTDSALGVTGASEFLDAGSTRVMPDVAYSTGTDSIAWLGATRANESGTTSRIRFWPPPDDNYLVEVKYFVVPQELRLDNDVPLVPRQFHPVILELADSLALSEEENHGAAGMKRSQAMEMVERMERDDEKDPGTSIRIGRGDSELLMEQNGSWPRTVVG